MSNITFRSKCKTRSLHAKICFRDIILQRIMGFLGIAPSQKQFWQHGHPSTEDTRWNIVSAHTPVKRTPGKVTFSCFGSPRACFQWFLLPQALWRSKQSSPSSGSNICLSLTACSMAPGSLWLEHTMSFSVMSTEICSDNVKAFRSFGQLRFAASSGLHSRDDTAPCVTLSSLQFQQTPRAQRRVTRFYSHIVLLAFQEQEQSRSFWLLLLLLFFLRPQPCFTCFLFFVHYDTAPTVKYIFSNMWKY